MTTGGSSDGTHAFKQRLDPAQLTLDDWAQMLSADREQARTPPPERTEAKGRISASVLALESATPPVPADLLEKPDALLTRTRLRELGLERRAVDAIFRALPVVALPGYARPMIRAQDYLAARRAIHLPRRSCAAGSCLASGSSGARPRVVTAATSSSTASADGRALTGTQARSKPGATRSRGGAGSPESSRRCASPTSAGSENPLARHRRSRRSPSAGAPPASTWQMRPPSGIASSFVASCRCSERAASTRSRRPTSPSWSPLFTRRDERGRRSARAWARSRRCSTSPASKRIPPATASRCDCRARNARSRPRRPPTRSRPSCP